MHRSTERLRLKCHNVQGGEGVYCQSDAAARLCLVTLCPLAAVSTAGARSWREATAEVLSPPGPASPPLPPPVTGDTSNIYREPSDNKMQENIYTGLQLYDNDFVMISTG